MYIKEQCNELVNLHILAIMIFKVKQRGLLEKYDEEIDGEEKKSFVLGKSVTFSCMCLW